MDLKTIVRNNRFLFRVGIKAQRIKQKFKYPVLGKNNKITNKGVEINVKYDIIGNNNSIEIMSGSVLSDIKIFI